MHHHLLLLSTLLTLTTALPQRSRKGSGNGRTQQQQLTAQQQAARVPQGITTAQDGSTILDDTVTVKYVSPYFPPTVLPSFPSLSHSTLEEHAH
jgi:hypothetical protein